MAEHALQTVIRRQSAKNLRNVGDRVKHKSFGEGIIEEVDALTKHI